MLLYCAVVVSTLVVSSLGDFYACGCQFKRRLSFSWNHHAGHFASVQWSHFENEPEYYDKFWSWTRLIYLPYGLFGSCCSAVITKHVPSPCRLHRRLVKRRLSFSALLYLQCLVGARCWDRQTAMRSCVAWCCRWHRIVSAGIQRRRSRRMQYCRYARWRGQLAWH